VNQPEYGWHR